MTAPRPLAPTAGAPNRAPAVRQMFDDLAPRYDLANRVLSLGLDQSWRRVAIAALGTPGQAQVLDLCAGTLDLTRMLIDHGADHVFAADFSPEMLANGASKLREGEPYTIHCSDARELPFEVTGDLPETRAPGLRQAPLTDPDEGSARDSFSDLAPPAERPAPPPLPPRREEEEGRCCAFLVQERERERER